MYVGEGIIVLDHFTREFDVCFLISYFNVMRLFTFILLCRKTVYDKTNMEDIKLTNEELEIIQKIQSSAYPGNDTNPYEVK